MSGWMRCWSGMNALRGCPDPGSGRQRQAFGAQAALGPRDQAASATVAPDVRGLRSLLRLYAMGSLSEAFRPYRPPDQGDDRVGGEVHPAVCAGWAALCCVGAAECLALGVGRQRRGSAPPWNHI
jgi:hypothetical protein